MYTNIFVKTCSYNLNIFSSVLISDKQLKQEYVFQGREE